MDQIAISVYSVSDTSSRAVAYSTTKRATVPFQVLYARARKPARKNKASPPAQRAPKHMLTGVEADEQVTLVDAEGCRQMSLAPKKRSSTSRFEGEGTTITWIATPLHVSLPPAAAWNHSAVPYTRNTVCMGD